MAGAGAPAHSFGLLLAGGASSRLGRDKAPLPLPGSRLSFAENARRALADAGLPVLVAARDLERAAALLPGFPAVADGPGRGPAAALLGGHAAFPAASFLALACDMPETPPELLRFLAALEGDWVVPSWQDERGESRLEPLCALYRPPALAALARRVAAGRLDLRGLAGEPGLAVRYVSGDELAPFGDPRRVFANVNRPADLEAFAALRQAHLAAPPDRR